jgi:hypothetical protein
MTRPPLRTIIGVQLHWLAPLAAAAASVGLSWQRWINPFVDGSREMIVPARIAAGERLYRDVVYYYGPAGPWLNALCLGVFGRRWIVLEAVGLALSLILFVSLWALCARAGSPLSASLAVAVSAPLCIAAPNGGAFLFPYSFDALYALAFGFAALALSCGGPRLPRQIAAAGALALAISSKAEIGAAAAAVLLVGGARSSAGGPARRRALRIVGVAAGAALAIYLGAFAGVPWRDLSPEGPFALFNPPAEWRNVYRIISGLTDPRESITRLATATFLGVLVLGLAAGAAGLSRRFPRAAPGPEALWIACVAGAVALLSSPVGAPMEDRLPPLLSPMPPIAAASAAWLLRRPLDERGFARFLLFAHSAVVASRVALMLTYGATTTPYAILALPGAAASACVLALDALAIRAPNATGTRRCFAAAILALAALAVLRQPRFFSANRMLEVRTRVGSLSLPTAKAVAAAQTLEFLSRRAEPGDGLSGFPEAGFFNFVTGLRNPLREDQVLPGHLDARDEERVARRIREAGPRFVALVNQPSAAFGPVAFGRDYAVTLWREVERDYTLAGNFGQAPLDAPVGDPRFFIRVYERRPGPPGRKQSAAAPGL